MSEVSTFDGFSKKVLLIVDVQKSFKKFFTEKYVKEIFNYCKEFSEVYQIWDNHNINNDKDYLYDLNPEKPNSNDFWKFPNQIDIIEKRYNYDVNLSFYKSIISKKDFEFFSRKKLSVGETIKTTKGTIIVYVGNNHKFFHVPKKLYNLFSKMNGNQITIIGGSDSECLQDIFTSATSMKLNIKRNESYIYTSTNCPIK